MRSSRSVQAHKRKIVKQKMASRVEVVVLVLLLIVSLAHLLRLITGAELLVAGTQVPLWISFVGCIGPATLAGLFWWTRH
jgi:Na+/proline symporter